MMFRINSRAGTADYSPAKKKYPVLSELKVHHDSSNAESNL